MRWRERLQDLLCAGGSLALAGCSGSGSVNFCGNALPDLCVELCRCGGTSSLFPDGCTTALRNECDAKSTCTANGDIWSDPTFDYAARGGTGDAPTCDPPPTQCPGATQFGSDGFAICLASLPAQPLLLGLETIDTTSCAGGELVGEGTYPSLCVLAGTSVNVTGAIRATGANPLAIVATTGDLVIASTGGIDVSSRDGSSGAGMASPQYCYTGLDGTPGISGGGGAGGSFSSAGGTGGAGDGAGGVSPFITNDAGHVLGGCPGGNGGAGQASSGGAGGAGGGALYLFAQGSLQIDGPLDASGAGGAPGAPSAAGTSGGGGGGGAGGMIALYAGVAIALTADVFANGGGGGGAPGSATASAGGVSTSATGVGAGGGGGTGGAGGDGAIGAAFGAAGASSSAGGGGGGGGGGFVHVVSGQALGGAVSPPACVPHC